MKQNRVYTGQQNRTRGLRAEYVALLYLLLKGYRLLARRYRVRGGEIDLVMTKGQILVFVEVKARRTHEEALCALGPRQRRRIMRAAQAWEQGRAVAGPWRFDLVTFAHGICGGLSWPRHVVGAWSL